MPQEVQRQQNWNNGELDPHLLGRRDLKAYYNSAALLENLAIMPQGPQRRRPGQAHVDFMRRVLAAVPLDGAALTAPNGGTATDAASVNGVRLKTATAMGTVDPYVILEIDFGVPTEVHLIDVIDAGVQASGGEDPTPPDWEYPWHDDRPWLVVP